MLRRACGGRCGACYLFVHQRHVVSHGSRRSCSSVAASAFPSGHDSDSGGIIQHLHSTTSGVQQKSTTSSIKYLASGWKHEAPWQRANGRRGQTGSLLKASSVSLSSSSGPSLVHDAPPLAACQSFLVWLNRVSIVANRVPLLEKPDASASIRLRADQERPRTQHSNANVATALEYRLTLVMQCVSGRVSPAIPYASRDRSIPVSVITVT